MKLITAFLSVLFAGVLVAQNTTTIFSSPVEQLSPVAYFDFEATPTQLPIDLRKMAGVAKLRDTSVGTDPISVSGAIGQGWDFANTTDSLLLRGARLRSLGDIHTQDGLSFSLWLKHGSSENNSRAGGAGYERQWAVELKSNGGLIAAIGPVQLVMPSHLGLDDGTWHHVAATADFRSETNNVRLYFDGQLVVTKSAVFERPFFVYRSDHTLFLGVRANGGNSNHYGGALDDFAIFDYPLIQSQVEMLRTHHGQPVSVVVPEVELGPSITRSHSESVVSLNPTISNLPAGATFLWEKIQGVGAVSFGDVNAAATSVTFTPAGEYDSYLLRLTVTTPDIRVQDTVAVSFTDREVPVLRSLPALPPVGQHPRLIFTNADLPAMRARYATSSPAQSGATHIKNQLNTARSGNAAYLAMVAGDVTYDFGSSKISILSTLIANSAAVALMENDTVTLQELGTALSTLALAFKDRYEPNYNDYLAADADMHSALGYDFLFNQMTVPGRDAMREILAKMSRYRNAYGAFQQLEAVSGNWDLHHDHVVLCALAIEGEEGYDRFVFESNVRKFREFLNYYGIHQNGFAHEGDGYLNFGYERAAFTLLATAYRDENFFKTSRFYRNTEAKFREIQPWRGGAMYSHHDGQWWGTGFFTGNIYWVTQHLFPNDRIADYVAQAYAASGAEPRKNRIAAVLFSRPPLANNETQDQAAGDLSLSVAEEERGLVNGRSDWSEDAIRLDFECRMDLYETGHLHSDRNMFTFAALGRQWVTDQGYHETSNDMHATVLIDGFGQPGSAAARWKGGPGVFLGHQDDGTFMTAAGDASFAYGYHNGGPRTNDPDDTVDDPTIPNTIEPWLDRPASQTFTWADFVMPGTQAPAWKAATPIEGLSHYNQVQRAFRTVTLSRGARPYALIVDDIQKDADVHTYEWLAPLSNGTAVNPGIVEIESSDASQAVLRFETDTEVGSPRLLVRVLQADGTAATPPQIVTRAIGVYSVENGNPPSPYQLLVFRRDTVSPNFKVLLYPFRSGEALPVTTWDGSKLTLTVPSELNDEVTFIQNPNLRTEVAFNRLPPTSYFDWRSAYPSLELVDSPSTDDFDEDGKTNLMEFVAGTDPTSPEFSGLMTLVTEGGGKILRMPNNPNATGVRRVWMTSSDLENWDELEVSESEALSPQIDLLVDEEQPQLFYRYGVGY